MCHLGRAPPLKKALMTHLDASSLGVPVVGSVSVTLTSMFLSFSPQQFSLNLISTLSTWAFDPSTSATQGNGAFSTVQNVEWSESPHSFAGCSLLCWKAITPTEVSCGNAQARVPETRPFSDVRPASELFTQHCLSLYLYVQ